MSNFTVDNLFNAIKSLKQERSCLEQKLSEQRKRRENLERTLDAMKTKHGQIQDTKSKLKETLAVAQHKVAQTQAQAEKMQEEVDEKQKRLDGLNQEMESHRQADHNEAETMSNELSQVADRLLEMREENNEAHVKDMLGSCETTLRDELAEIDKTDYEIKQLASILDDLHIKSSEDEIAAAAQGIPVWQQRMVLNMFTDKICSLAQSIDMFQAKKNELQKAYDEVHAQRDRLGEELENIAISI